MPAFTDATEQGLLQYFIATYSATTKYFGFSSTTPNRDGTGVTEPTGNGYARVSTGDANWAPATGSNPASIATSAAHAFAAATGDWASGDDLTHWVLFSALTAGTVLAYGLLDTAKPVLSGDTPSIPIGGAVIYLGDPGDTYPS